jgi:glycosyltransferase involved in cell wall biosynthesis
MKKLSVIIPVYNEAATVTEVIEKVGNVVLPGIQKQIIVVDDGSTDGSRQALRELRERGLIDDLLLNDRNIGKGGALKAGLRCVAGDYVLIQDADLEYDFEDVLGMVQEAEAKAKVVFGSRFLKKNKRNFFYTLGNITATKLFNWFFGVKLSDLTTCYKLFPADLIADLFLIPADDFVFDTVDLTLAIVRRGWRIKEVPISYKPRSVKEKKLKFSDGIKIIMAIFQRKFQYEAR